MNEIILDIQKVVCDIYKALKDADTTYSSSKNATGDTQLGFDLLSDELITKHLSKNSNIKALISEEKDKALELNKNAKYIVAYDPLDGSSLMDVNLAIGSIFAIYQDELSPKNLKAALYSIYSARLELVICLNSPKLYRLNQNNEFSFIQDIKLNQKGKILSPGGTNKFYSQTHRTFIQELFNQEYRLRYSGAFVSDMHQILLKQGGLFCYPSTLDNENGKLRAFFEIFPFAYIVEKAGGKTSNGFSASLLELEFDNIHATSPCFLGSEYEINELLRAYNG